MCLQHLAKYAIGVLNGNHQIIQCFRHECRAEPFRS